MGDAGRENCDDDRRDVNCDIKVAAYTLGCKVNLCDTEGILELFAARGYEIVDFEDFAHIYVINTCTVTGLGDKKSRQMIRRARAKNPGAVVVACGCYAQVMPEELGRIGGVNLIVGTKNRSGIVDAVEGIIKDIAAGDTPSAVSAVRPFDAADAFEELRGDCHDPGGPRKPPANRTRAFLKVQDGCENRCSYCVIPYARGGVRSRAEESALSAARGFEARGYKEIVVTGIHLASYGKDNKTPNRDGSGTGPHPLIRLLTKLHELEGIRRIRLGSLEPLVADEAFIAGLSALPKVCPHFHLSLQSGCDRVLKRMNRRYTADQYAKAVRVIRSAYEAAAITTDIIVGFPGETEEDFLETCRFVEGIKPARVHVFPYSRRRGTPASLFPDQLPARVKNERAARMIKIGAELERAFLRKHAGARVSVLFEELHGGFFEGYTGDYIKVKLPRDERGFDMTNLDMVNEIAECTVVDMGDGFVLASL